MRQPTRKDISACPVTTQKPKRNEAHRAAEARIGERDAGVPFAARA